MTAQNLDFLSGICGPQAASLVHTSSYDTVTLRIELNFANLVLMPLEQRHTRPCKHVVDASNSIRTGGGHFVTSAVKARVKNFIIVAAEGLHALPGANIPQLAGSVDASG